MANNVLIGVEGYLSNDQMSELSMIDYLSFFPKRNIIILQNEENQKELFAAFPQLKEWEKDYDFRSLTDILEDELEDGYKELNVKGFDCELNVDMQGVLEGLIDDAESLEDYILESDTPEKTYDEYIDAAISHIFTTQILSLVRNFESKKENYFFEADFLRLDGTKHYNVSVKKKDIDPA